MTEDEEKAIEAVMARFRKLPESERERIFELAGERLAKAMEQFIKTATKLEGFSDETKKQAIESIMGPLGQTEEEALEPDSRWSKSFDSGIIAAIIQIMEEEEK